MNLIYEQLEKGMLTYRDLQKVPVRENREPLVALNTAQIPWKYREPFTDMKDALGNVMKVRKSVASRLVKAQRILRNNDSSLSLCVCYGYRSPAIQKQRFLTVLKQLSDTFYDDPYELYEQVHRRVAVPTVAGHPSGAAVDITIQDSIKNDLDFGSPLYDYRTKKFYTFSPEISASQKAVRNLLRTVMMNAGFAPFDGEWWHFSYGDREWAMYYDKPFALYNQL